MTEGEKRKKSFVMYSLLLERCSYPHNNSVTPSTEAAVKYSVQATAAQKLRSKACCAKTEEVEEELKKKKTLVHLIN